MKEDFLHYVWKYQKFAISICKTTTGKKVQVVHPGQHNFNAGPDFLHAQLSIDGQLWAGNVELHLKSSDWYAHKHQEDPAYESVVLHVVWEYNVAVFRANDTVIPTLVLKDLVLPSALSTYQTLVSKKVQFIACEQEFYSVDTFLTENWLERMYLERLEEKTEQLLQPLSNNANHWEALLFQQLCKNFGLKVNGDSFHSVAMSVPFSVVQKCKNEIHTFEALLLGQAGLLDIDSEDDYFLKLKQEFAYLQKKFNLKDTGVIAPKYFRLRPSNFPTIRLSQFAALYCNHNHLFSSVISAKTKEEIYRLFDVKASTYWDAHYNFGVTSAKRVKRLTSKFIDLLIINTLLPFQFCYARQQGKDVSEAILAIAVSIAPEQNTVIQKFNKLQLVSQNAIQTQGVLQLYNEYCKPKRCLNCAIGNTILNRK